MRKFFTPFILSAFLFMPNIGKATVLLNEHFNQATESLATNSNNSGDISGLGWQNVGGSGQIYINATDLTYSGYKSATDETKSIEYKATFGKTVAKSFTSTNSGSLYAAAIIKVTGTTTSAPAREYLFSFASAVSGVSTSSNHFGRLYVQKTDTKYKLGISKAAETSFCISYTDELEYNTEYLVVVEYVFRNGTRNDSACLYVSPTKGTKPAPTIATKQVAINPNTSTDVGAGTKDDPAQLQSFVFYSSSSNKWACLIDELKVTTSWDDLWEAGEDPDPEPVIGVPEPEASDVTISSASIAWDAVEDADSYVLQWKVNGGSYSDDIEIDKDVRSYSMTGLESETKYFVRVKTIIGEDASEWATINFTTEAEPDILVYKEISFDKYSTQDAMPTSGTVYLAKNVVEYGSGDPLTTTLSGNLTLNLHGKQLFMYGGHIVVPSGVTFTIYDDAGTGEITGGYAGSYVERGIITVKEGGTLIIGEGAVINLDDESEQVAIHNLGTLKLSGAPVISGNRTDIYLGSTITIESDKPLTNSTPYKVYKTTGSSFTSGWANMNGESPKDYFSSTNAGNRGVCLNASGEAQIVPALNLSEDSNNPSIASNNGQLVNVSFTRSLTSSQFNTFCLPFALDDDQLQEFFGAGYDLEEFVSSSLEDDVLSIVFNKVTSLEAGKPYLLQPSVDVANPSFEGVTISATSPVDQTSDTYISFHGTYAPTELTGGNRNLLFLGAGNELFWPAEGGNNTIKGFRAYFEVKGGAAQGAKRARIVKKEEGATGMDQITNDKLPMTNKILRNGQLLILRDNKTYNVLGMEYK